VNLQPVHLVGVSVNVIWVTSRGPGDEYVHQFQIFAILQYVVKLHRKARIFSPIFRQLALTWQAVCTQIVVRGSNVSSQVWNVWRGYNLPILSYGTFYLYNRVTLTFGLFFPKLGHVTGSSCSIHVPNFECIGLIFFEICGNKMQILWPSC